jgi:hypothetical protein
VDRFKRQIDFRVAGGKKSAPTQSSKITPAMVNQNRKMQHGPRKHRQSDHKQQQRRRR